MAHGYSAERKLFSAHRDENDPKSKNRAMETSSEHPCQVLFSHRSNRQNWVVVVQFPLIYMVNSEFLKNSVKDF